MNTSNNNYNTSQKASDEKAILLDTKVHRVSAKEALFLRYAAIVVSWISTIVSLILAVAAIGFAITNGTQSLFGFGLDALLDSLSSAIILWRFHGQDIYSQIKEIRACLMIGSLFIVSALLLAGKSIQALIVKDLPDESTVAILISSITAVLCLLLGTFKVVIGFKLESKAIIIDSVITFTGAVMAIYSLIFSAVYASNTSVWYLDDVFGIVCSVFLIIYGIRTIVVSSRDLRRLDKSESQILENVSEHSFARQ